MTRPLVLGTLAVALSLAACRDRTPVVEPGAPSPAAAAPAEPSAAAPLPGSAAAAPVSDAAVPAAAPQGAETPATVVQDAAPAAGRLAAPGPATPAATLLREAVALDPAGPIPLSRDEETVVDPATTFRLVLAAEVPEARLVLLDGADAIVASSGTREVGATSTLTLTPSAPLVPGSHYLLRLDGARTRELHDAAGRAYAPLNLSLLVAGEPPKAEPKPKPKPAPRKRRSRR
ncbi:hypothetical protein [Anaeromyxobacter terrae]|uniref:hypothetical protein n=1 Tax=Anaeromyxobacter terrae TaxID=2925406 RepID=UPI001F5774B3|nr:hypothetical protein [Anaeromyxobacter sp. SG22]